MIASLPFFVFVVMLLFLGGMAGIAIYGGVRAGRSAAIVRATPTSPIGMAADGYREIEGTIEAVPGAALTAPLTKQPCVWYEMKVEQYGDSTGGEAGRQGRWVTVTSATSRAPFLVRDATGVCIVDPDRADVTPTDKSLWFGNTKQPKDRNPPKVGPTESAGGMLQIAGSHKYKYFEARMYAGDPVLVLGHFASHRFEARVGEDDEPDAGAGDGDAGAAGSGPAPADEAVVSLERDDAMMDAARRVTRLVMTRGAGPQPFIITTTSQAQHIALSTLGSRAAFGIAAVPLAIAALLIWLRYG